MIQIRERTHFSDYFEKKYSPPHDEIRQCLIYEVAGGKTVDHLILSGGLCRQGTTPWGMIARALKIPYVYQAEKAVDRSLRAGIQPQEIRYGEIDSHPHYGEEVGLVVESKFAIGGPSFEDSFVNPLQAHRKVEGRQGGIEVSKMSIVHFERNPYETFYSWVRLYLNDFYQREYGVSREQLLENFIAAHNTREEFYFQSQREGIPQMHFVQELLQYRGNGKEVMEGAEEEHVAQIIFNIFNHSGVPITFDQAKGSITWDHVTEAKLRSEIIFPSEPAYDFEGALMTSVAKGKYRYSGKGKENALPHLTDHEIAMINLHGMPEFYNDLLSQSIKDLGLREKDYSDLYI